MIKTNVERYIKHAKSYGTELVFETAVEESLTPRELGALSIQLKQLNPQWSLRSLDVPFDQVEFARQLIDSGYRLGRALDMAQISRSTWRQHEKASADGGSRAQNELSRPIHPILSVEA